jgi:hypothetical protein
VAVDRQLTVRNTGNAPLTLAPLDPNSLPTGFALVSNFASTNLAPGQSTTFTLRLHSAQAGTYAGPISWGNNDSDENPFRLSLQGAVVSVPQPIDVQILDDGDSGQSMQGVWTAWPHAAAHGNAMHYSLSGTGQDVASWVFAVTPGLYRVSTTWVPHTNRAPNAPYTILNGNSALATIPVNQRAAPNDLYEAGVGWEHLGGTFEITSSTLAVRLTDQAGGTVVVADAVRVERVGDIVIAPEIRVLHDATNFDDGAVLNFGETTAAVAADRQLTVRNVGNAPLTIAPLDPNSLPSGFALVSNFARTSLAPGQATTLTLRLQSAQAGSYGGTISFATNDADEDPFHLTLQGQIVSVPEPSDVQILDAGDNGHSLRGAWVARAQAAAFGGTMHYSLTGTGRDVAAWSFTVTPGVYRVATTWTPHANRAPDAPYTVNDGGRALGTVRVDQRQAPADFSEAGVGWHHIGQPFQITSSTLLVRLTDAARGTVVVADAVRIERISDLPN